MCLIVVFTENGVSMFPTRLSEVSLSNCMSSLSRHEEIDFLHKFFLFLAFLNSSFDTVQSIIKVVLKLTKEIGNSALER